MRVWVTRAEPGAEATAQRLRALGHDPLVAPLLAVRALPDAALDLDGVGALAFTSANAPAICAGLTSVRDLPVFAVGEATATAARAAGFTRVDSADGDVAALAARIVAAGVAGSVLHPSAAEPAGDLAGALAAARVAARSVPVYETVALEPAVLTEFDAVLVHSPRAAKALAQALSGTRVDHIEVFALSHACAAPLAGGGFKRLGIAAQPNEAALLALLAM